MNFLKNLTSQQTVSVTSYPMCSVHNRPLTYMCLSKTCVSKLFCEYCVSQNHAFHQNEIQNISDFLARVPYQRKSSDFSLITQVKSLINIKNKIVTDMNQSLTNSENKILDHFDELKKELNFQLDLAYSEYCQKNRDINTKTTLKVESKMKKMGVILKLQEIMVNRANVEVQNQEELQNLVKYVSKHMDKLTQLGDTLKAKQKELDQILVEHDHVLAQFDGAKFQATKNAISTFVRKAFNIKEVVSEPQANVGPDPTRMENRNSGGSQEGYTGHEGDIYAVSILNKQLIATGGQDRVIKLWNLQNGECTGELYGHKDKVWALISAYEGKYIVSASEDKTIKVWKLAERKCTKTFLGHTDSVQCLEYLKVQKILVSGSRDGLIMLWDMNEGKASKTLAAHKRGIWALHGMKNENLISAGSDCLIKIWDSRSWGCLQTLVGHKATVYGLCSFNNEQNLISCSEDETLRVWEIREGICVQVVKGHDRGVRSLGMNVSETLVATGGADRCLKIWDLKSLKLLKTQENNDAMITSTQFYDDYSVLYADRNPKFFKLNVI